MNKLSPKQAVMSKEILEFLEDLLKKDNNFPEEKKKEAKEWINQQLNKKQ